MQHQPFAWRKSYEKAPLLPAHAVAIYLEANPLWLCDCKRLEIGTDALWKVGDVRGIADTGDCVVSRMLRDGDNAKIIDFYRHAIQLDCNLDAFEGPRVVIIFWSLAEGGLQANEASLFRRIFWPPVSGSPGEEGNGAAIGDAPPDDCLLKGRISVCSLHCSKNLWIRQRGLNIAPLIPDSDCALVQRNLRFYC